MSQTYPADLRWSAYHYDAAVGAHGAWAPPHTTEAASVEWWGDHWWPADYESAARRGRGALGRDRRTTPAEEHALRRLMEELEEARRRRFWQRLPRGDSPSPSSGSSADGADTAPRPGDRDGL